MLRIGPRRVAFYALVGLALSAGTARAALIEYLPLHGDTTAAVGTDGTAVNGPTVDTGYNGAANGSLHFAPSTNTGSYVSVAGGGGLNNLQTGTIDLWVKWSGTQEKFCCGNTFGNVTARQGDGLFSNDVIGIDSSDPAAGHVTWQPYSAGPPVMTGSTVVGDGTWHNIAVTFSPGAHNLYVDGVLDATSAANGAFADSSGIPLTIGAWTGDGHEYSNSSVSDVRIYDSVLTQDQVRQLVPEPSSCVLLLLGAVGLACLRRRRA